MAEDFPLKTGSESTLRQTTFCKDMAPHDGYLLKSLYSLLTSFVCNTIMASPTLHEQIVREENSQMPCGDLKIKTTHFVPALLSTCWSDYRIECLYYDNNEEKKNRTKKWPVKAGNRTEKDQFSTDSKAFWSGRKAFARAVTANLPPRSLVLGRQHSRSPAQGNDLREVLSTVSKEAEKTGVWRTKT